MNKIIELFKCVFKNKNSIIKINGETYVGSSIKIIIDDKEIIINDKIINIECSGDCASISTISADVTIIGTCNTVKSTSGDINVNGTVIGEITSISGDIKCKSINNSTIKTISGDIRR